MSDVLTVIAQIVFMVIVGVGTGVVVGIVKESMRR